MERHFLLGPARLHAANRMAVAIADCPLARTIPSVSGQAKRHDRYDRDAPPQQACTARMIAFIVQFHRMQGAKHMLARLHSYWKSGSSEMCCTFSSRMNRVA